jgi:hypothetical protein
MLVVKVNPRSLPGNDAGDDWAAHSPDATSRNRLAATNTPTLFM